MELIRAEARIDYLQHEAAGLKEENAMLRSQLACKSSSLDSGASEGLHTAQASSEPPEHQIKQLQEEVRGLQHDKWVLESDLEDMGGKVRAAEARADRFEALQEDAKLPCLPVNFFSLTNLAGDVC